eukprot:1147780-Pelagomonas_calceolata.AAC.2
MHLATGSAGNSRLPFGYAHHRRGIRALVSGAPSINRDVSRVIPSVAHAHARAHTHTHIHTHTQTVAHALRSRPCSTGNPLRPSSRASTPSSARVHAPKFPPVNPIVAMRATEPPPAYSVAYGASSYGGPGTPGASRLGTPLSRPYTANPITHTLDEGPRPATGVASRAGSTRGSTHGLASRCGRKPLHTACYERHRDIVQLLLGKGAASGQEPSTLWGWSKPYAWLLA